MVGELPEGWANASGPDLFRFIRGVTYAKGDVAEALQDGTIGILRANNIQDGHLNMEDLVYVPERCVSEEQRLQVGDIVVATSSGSLTVVGKAARVEEPLPGVSFGAFCCVLRPHDLALSDWICKFTQTRGYRRFIESKAAGININNLRASHLESISLAIPPLREVQRTCSLLGQYRARQANARAALEAIPPLLNRFRQSVLAAAFRGDLTADWRAKNPDVEPASELLKRIRVERRRRWEDAELQKMRAKGKVPGDDRWKAKYVEPQGVDAESLPELPEGWVWATVGEVSEVEGGIQKQPSRRTGRDSFPFLRVANVFWGRLDLEEVHQIELFDGELERLRLHEGDLLVVEGNGSPTEIGRMAIWDGRVENCVHQNHLIRVRALGGLSPHFLSHFWSSPVGRQRVAREAQTTTGLYNLSKGKVSKLPVPVAPTAEQDALLAHLAPLLEFSRSMEGLSSSSPSRLTTLHQSLLAKAFRGELVPQDPDDESASVLLERIRQEREAAGGDEKSRRGRKAKQS